MRLIEKIKELFAYLINYCDCPFDPDDNPFPQSCDKQTINSKWCENECPWRKRFNKERGIEKMTAKEYARTMREECYRRNKDIMQVTSELWLEIADDIEKFVNQAVEDYKNSIIEQLEAEKEVAYEGCMYCKNNPYSSTMEKYMQKYYTMEWCIDIVKCAANVTNGKNGGLIK